MQQRHRITRRGTALAEFCFCLPFLFFLLFGAMEFGFMIYDSLELEDACRDACRWAALGNSDANVAARIRSYFPLRNLTNPVTTIDEFDPAGNLIGTYSDPPGSGSPATQRVPGSSIKVSVSVSCQWLTPIQAVFGGQRLGMSASATFRIQTPGS